MLSDITSASSSLLSSFSTLAGLNNSNNSSSTSSTSSSNSSSIDDIIKNLGTSSSEASDSASESSDSTASSGSGGSGGGSSSSSSSSKMDLNGDGVVTVDEILQYLEMQKADNSSDPTKSASEQQESDTDAFKDAVNQFKTKNATQAYQSTFSNLMLFAR